eukprot:716706_1
MALPNDRHFREKYRGKNPLIFLQAQLPQQQYLFKRKKIGSGLQDAIVLEKISIYHGSIVDDELIDDVEAVILPANEKLWADGSGVCGAIFKKAGYDKLQKACNNITSQTDDHSIPNGQSVITPAFDLNVKYIIHAIAPCEQNNEHLISCYISALELCVKMGIRNVAFPCIGTGDGNFSQEAACSIALRCVRGWLCDANNVKYLDFMNKSKAESKKKKWHKNINIEHEEINDEEDIYKINDETVADRILNVVFCCYDDINWNLYCQIVPKIFPADDKHSYLWIDKIRSLEYKCMLHHINSLEMENKKLKGDEYKEDDINDTQQQQQQPIRNRNRNNLQKLYIEVMKAKEQYNIAYTKTLITEMIKTSPKSLLKINKESMNTLNYLNKMQQGINEFIRNVEDISGYVSTVSSPDINKYKQWTCNDIVIWILSLDNGRFADYIDQIKDGLIDSEINDGQTLLELTRSDLSVPPFNINSFKVKKDLIAHFQSLKTGYNTNLNDNFEGDDDTSND